MTVLYVHERRLPTEFLHKTLKDLGYRALRGQPEIRHLEPDDCQILGALKKPMPALVLDFSNNPAFSSVLMFILYEMSGKHAFHYVFGKDDGEAILEVESAKRKESLQAEGFLGWPLFVKSEEQYAYRLN